MIHIYKLSDAQVYLKLAYLYEDLASQDWSEAATNAERCYKHYLTVADSGDVSVLTRLGNLLVREGQPAEAVAVAYAKVVALEPDYVEGWFNMAQAQVQAGDYLGARKSFEQTLVLMSGSVNVSTETSAMSRMLPIVRYMLRALRGNDENNRTHCNDDAELHDERKAYVIALFEDFALHYDAHMQSQRYSAPRLIRQELARIYKERYTTTNTDVAAVDAGGDNFSSGVVVNVDEIEAMRRFNSADTFEQMHNTGGAEIETISAGIGNSNGGVSSDTSCGSTYISFMNRSLAVLDLGCGTGRVGAWLRDYSHSLTGVDLSPPMLAVARRKGLYDKLYYEDIHDFLQRKALEVQQQRNLSGGKDSSSVSLGAFDLIVAADVLPYIGEVDDLFQQVKCNISALF